jgi:hypothetical protein
VYSCSEKKNQGRFRYVGSDHSLVSLKYQTISDTLVFWWTIISSMSPLGHCGAYISNLLKSNKSMIFSPEGSEPALCQMTTL